MERIRRRFVVAAAAGVGGLLAGCVGSGPTDDGSTTAEDSENSTATTADEPLTSAGRDTATERETTASQRRTPVNATESTTTSSKASTGAVPSAPTSPAGLELVTQAGDLTITEIEVGPPGTDSPSIVGEHVDLQNTGSDPLDLAGYSVEYGGTGKRFEFPDSSKAVVPAGGTARVTTGSGGATLMLGEYEFLAGFAKPILKTNGGSIAVTDPGGNTVLRARY